MISRIGVFTVKFVDRMESRQEPSNGMDYLTLQIHTCHCSGVDLFRSPTSRATKKRVVALRR
jgi:hypothetical protein